MDSLWRPLGHDSASCLPVWDAQRALIDLGYTAGWVDTKDLVDLFEAGASAIIPCVEAQTLREVGEWLKTQVWWRDNDLCGILEEWDIDDLLKGEMPGGLEKGGSKNGKS